MRTNDPPGSPCDHFQTRRAALRHAFAIGLIGGVWPTLSLLAEETTPAKPPIIMNPNLRLFSFVGGRDGLWKITAARAIAGDALPAVERLNIVAGNIASPPAAAAWVLRGATSNERYATRPEKEQLLAKQPALGRPEADCAVLIPIRKNAKWWALTQDERREIFEAQSHHTQIGQEYLPAIARRLHHCRDLSAAEPFDFLTWFEFAKNDTADFDRMLARLRASAEWKYVEREVELRLTLDKQDATR